MRTFSTSAKFPQFSKYPKPAPKDGQPSVQLDGQPPAKVDGQQLVDFHVELKLHRASDVKVGIAPPRDKTNSAAAPPALRRVVEKPEKARDNVYKLSVSTTELQQLESGTLEVATSSVGDPVRVSAVVLRSNGRCMRASVVGDACTSATYNFRDCEEDEQLFVDPPRYLELMAARLAKEWDHPLNKARWFFFLLDYETNALFRDLHTPAPVPTDGIIDTLRSQMAARAKLSNRGKAPYRPLPSQETQEKLRPIVALMRRLMERCFPSIDEYKQAIIAFANGSTRFQLTKERDGDSGMWTCQPSSGYFFLFGELALTAVALAQQDMDAEAVRFWAHAAEAAIKAQPVFVQVFKEKTATGRESFGDFKICGISPLSQEETDFLVGRLTPICAVPDLSELRTLAGKYAASFLPGLLPPPPPPVPTPPLTVANGLPEPKPMPAVVTRT